MGISQVEQSPDRPEIEIEIQSQVDTVKDFLNSDGDCFHHNVYLDPLIVINEYITTALNYNSETKRIGEGVSVQWLDNHMAQAVIEIERFAEDSIDDLRKREDLCRGNIERFDMSFIYPNSPVVFEIK